MVGPINLNNDIKVPTLAWSRIPGDPGKHRCFFRLRLDNCGLFRLRKLSLDSYKKFKISLENENFLSSWVSMKLWLPSDFDPKGLSYFCLRVTLLLKNFLSPSFKISSTYPPTPRYSLHPFLSTYNYVLDCTILKIHFGAWEYGPPADYHNTSNELWILQLLIEVHHKIYRLKLVPNSKW